MIELVSIVSTLYNYSNFVSDMINSVKDQNYDNWELIIVDDGSSDNPDKIILPFVEKDDRIRYIKLGKNRGYSVAKNEGIISSSGQYITMIDADDMLTENSVKYRLKSLKKSKAIWAHGNAYNLGSNGKITPDTHFSSRWKRTIAEKRYSDLWSCIHAQTIMVKREFHEILGLYDEQLRASSDREMWKRAVTFGYIPEYLNNFVSIYRKHAKQMSKSKWKRKNKNKLEHLLNKNLKNRVKNGINSSNTRILHER